MANEFLQWLMALEREFMFLLALPFVVAIVGLWSWWKDKEQIDREYEARAAQADALERRIGERRKGERRRGGSRGKVCQ
jgi:hypothetical protein